ncbi:bifunctional heparan sulfate N-deacetylase/N-sulfotransferase 4-like [Dysidea avara]|uniref:bifunctional heparan sulfate N-deacetylase/N-sulfotransferase 4-like n=1 Tax=Dysidea avara TaxID=196820 RepID=UPI003326862A
MQLPLTTQGCTQYIDQPLYDAWAEVWGVMVTSTEEYPHLRPDYMRRGFVHNNVKVLPRQLCNLYTKTYKYEHFATGKEGIREMAEGGYVFEVLMNTPVSIFMTHISNYGNDRLALFLFEHTINFIQKWTNLQLVTEPPLKLAEIYFNLFPSEKLPVWTSPCDDHRHLDIWMGDKNCSQLPNFLIVGPQKTGSTALASFLGHHPLLVANKDNPVTFEEVQFFSDDQNYQKGIEWYMSNFQYPKPNQLLFEKSATYFTHSMAPFRAATLLPEATIIILLHDPVIRAYSWYQHMRAHSDPIALENSFLSVLQADSSTANTALVGLKKHCLEPGIYHLHIQRWLEYYNRHQVHFVDGTRVITDPVKVLHDIQVFLKVADLMDYSQYIKFSKTKGFYCFTMKNEKQKCLGPGKGRHYPGMSSEARSLLQNYYKPHNQRLANLLHELKVPLPEWLTAKS